jgi:rubrerythrin
MTLATRADGREDLACLFERLEHEESLHIDQLLELAGTDGFDPDLVEKDLNEILGDEIDIPAGFEFSAMTVYASLAEAVRAEEKAFAFYSFLVSDTKDPEIKALAEDLAKEELDHAALLRQARRAAFRGIDREAGLWPNPETIITTADFSGAAKDAETAYLERHAGLLTKLGILGELRDLLSRKIPGSGWAEKAGADGIQEEGDIRAAVDEAQAAFEFYDAVATGTLDQDVMMLAQDMTEVALARIKLLSGALVRPNAEGAPKSAP